MAADVHPPIIPDGSQTGRNRSLLRQVIAALTIIQLVTGGLIAIRGFPYFGSAPVRPAPLWELPVALYHLPGIGALSLTGHCCGLGRNMVIGPRIRGGHIRLSAGGGFILVATNLLAWLLLWLVGWWGWRRWHRTRGAGA